MAQYHTKFTIGRGFDRDGVKIPLPERMEILRALEAYAADHTDGFTLIFGEGCWRDGEQLIREPVVVFETDIWAGTSEEITRMGAAMAEIARQKSVHVSIIEVYAVNV